tara:strand:+ start:541 stop:708 length:168 start_codon:yes stop_codon:yes gene_type:complete
MSHIEVSDIIIEEPIIENTYTEYVQVPEVSVDYIDVFLVCAIIILLTRFIKSLKS